MDGKARMAHACFTKFSPLLLPKFLLREVADMYQKDPNTLQKEAATTLQQIELKAPATDLEVSMSLCIHSHFLVHILMCHMFCLCMCLMFSCRETNERWLHWIICLICRESKVTKEAINPTP